MPLQAAWILLVWAGAAEPDTAALELPSSTTKARKKESGAQEIGADYIRSIPNTMNDPVRAVSFLPGVTVANDVNVRPYVRGGDAGQTQVVMNGIPLLHPYHVGGTFSVFNLGMLDGIELFREDFPVENPGSLSGVLRLKSKPPSLERARLNANLSLVRGDALAELPLVKDRLGLHLAAQSFLFDHSLHGILDLASRFSEDSHYQQDIQEYHNHINFPGFQDYHAGLAYSGGDFQARYSGSLSLDDYAVLVPSQTNILPKPKPDPGRIVPDIPVIPKKEVNRTKKLSIDSISSVDIDNRMHFLNLAWDMDPRSLWEQDFGLQSQDWLVSFKEGANASAPLALSHTVRTFNYRLSLTRSFSPGNHFKSGLSYDYRWQMYDVEMPYVLYDVMVNGNMDMLEALGNFSDEGFIIQRPDSSRSNGDYLGAYPARINFSHHGESEEHTGSLFFSHALETRSGKLTYGLRAEYQRGSGEIFPAPRLGYLWRAGRRDELLFSAGLYAQNSLPFYQRDGNPGLKSEKSAQVGAQWSHAFGDGYRFSVQNYYKRYYDLVAATLVPDGTIDLDAFLQPHPGSGLSAGEIADLGGILDTVEDFAALPDSVREAAYAVFGGLDFRYANTGTGNSLGTELSFFYRPNPIWNGWLSADFSLSDRRDAPGRPSYAYRYHRPVVFNWVNHFDMPSRYAVGFTYRWAMGQPYTPYTGALDETGGLRPIEVGARNSGRLAPYSRLDLRLTRNARWWQSDVKAYVEVWNSMNHPNYFGRDSRTGQLKSAQLNWPFPLLFLGLSAAL